MLSDGAEMVRRDGISDGDVGAGEAGMEAVEVLAEPVQRAAIEGEIGWVEADVEGACGPPRSAADTPLDSSRQHHTAAEHQGGCGVCCPALAIPSVGVHPCFRSSVWV